MWRLLTALEAVEGAGSRNWTPPCIVWGKSAVLLA